MLVERRDDIAQNISAAGTDTNESDTRAHLSAAQSTLHQIAGTAGSLGFAELGNAARDCEMQIIDHLKGDTITPCPAGLQAKVERFVMQCGEVLNVERMTA